MNCLEVDLSDEPLRTYLARMAMHPLAADHYAQIDAMLRELPINTLFARAVVRGHAPGRVLGDDASSPRAFYVAHQYGMSLLFGSPGSEPFTTALEQYLTGVAPARARDEWLQVCPDEWSGLLERILGDRLLRSGASEGAARCIVEDVRVNFRFDPQLYAARRAAIQLPEDCSIVGEVRPIYEQMKGSVVPGVFWESAEELEKRGAAYALLHRGELASTAFASFAMDGMLELGIETVERFRGRGFALHACCALIDHCLARNLKPVWACRLTNVASYRLALSLGFVHVKSLPYYRLPASARGPEISS